MRKALVFTGGSAPELSTYDHEISDAELVVAADSGYDKAVYDGVSVDVLIGDMDSIRTAVLPGTRVLTYPEDKDFTDTELALSHIHETLGDVEVVIIGGGEGRLDHTVSMIGLFRTATRPARWYTRRECVYYVDTFMDLELERPGTTISVIALQDEPSRVISSGLHWELKDALLSNANASISNRNISSHVRLEVLEGKGVLLCVSY
jgi:thiamine pyrophosphokinase